MNQNSHSTSTPENSSSQVGMIRKDSINKFPGQEIIHDSSTNSNTPVRKSKRLRKQSTPSRSFVRRKMTPRKEIPQTSIDIIEDESSSLSAPISPPQNTRKIDNYFAPKEPSHQDSHPPMCHSLFGTKSSSEIHSIPCAEELVTPTHSRDTSHTTQRNVNLTNEIVPDNSNNVENHGPFFLQEARSNDVHVLLMSKDIRIKELEHDLQVAKEELASYQTNQKNLITQKEEYDLLKDNYKKDVEVLKSQLARLQTENQEYKDNSKKSLEKWIRNYAFAMLYKKQDMMVRDDIRIGSVVLQQMGHRVVETWHEGNRYKEVKKALNEVNEVKERVESERRSLKKKSQRQDREKESTMSPPLQSIASSTNQDNEDSDSQDFDQLAKWEVIKSRLNALKKQQAEYQEELAKLDVEKEAHIREVRRIRDEMNSKYCERPLLQNRYQIIELLGKGGFSEVWYAFDMQLLSEVAIKIHQLASNWSDERKSSYIKHAIRENEIQRRLCHENVVHQLDSFVIDSDSFATVLEYCPGTDLERYLKQNVYLKETEARAITIQILSALKYMNGIKNKIIHYDLKPGNILFDANGNVKITDFGLSKEMDPTGDSKMALTSQGAGTYWYLPPECFKTNNGSAPLISQKVDVWSVGIILYQMVYGKKPFGDDLSQESILQDHVILNITDIEFPSKPVVSNECKNFILCCLQKDEERRWDVNALCEHPFITQQKLK